MRRTTRYFDEQVLRKRPYLSLEMCEVVLQSPIRTVVQADGRIRFFGKVTHPENQSIRVLRVVVLEDGLTIHNAFFDRGFRDGEE